MNMEYPTPQEAPETRVPLYNRFLERGREGKNEWWRYGLGVFLTVIVGYQLIGVLPLALLTLRSIVLKRISLGDLMANPNGMLQPDFLHVSRNAHLAAVLMIFVGAMLFLWIAVRFIHRKRMMSVINGVSNTFDFRRYFTAFFIWITICAAQLAIALKLSPETFTWVFQPGPFFIGLLICLILLPIQTGWEEIFLRGYLMQGLGLWLKSPLIPLILTSVVFGLLHLMNQEVQTNGIALMLPQYILPGLIFGAIALMDERLELAMGMHFANNLFGLMTISSPDMSIQANSIWYVESTANPTDAIFGASFQLIALLIFYRMYKWNYRKLIL